MKQKINLLSINTLRTVHLYTPVKTIQPMLIGFAGFMSQFVGMRDVDFVPRGDQT